MSVKSLRNQLLAAIAMVLVATIALGSSTYAWFASNGTVTANNMQVQAAAEGGIEIAYYTPALKNNVVNYTLGDYSTIASASVPAAQLNPTSTANATDWYHARAEVIDNKNARIDTYKNITNQIVTNENGVGKVTLTDDPDNLSGSYYLYNKFQIRTTSQYATAKSFKIAKVTVTNSDQELNQALRVAVVVNNQTAAIFAPAYDTDTTTNVWDGSTTTGTLTTLLNKTVTNHSGAEVVSYELKNGDTELAIEHTTGVTAEIYVYFEGEDANLKSTNLKQTMNTLSVTVDFTANVENTVNTSTGG